MLKRDAHSRWVKQKKMLGQVKKKKKKWRKKDLGKASKEIKLLWIVMLTMADNKKEEMVNKIL